MIKHWFQTSLALLLVTGCQNTQQVDRNDDYDTATRREKKSLDSGKFFGEDAFLFGDNTITRNKDGSMIGVNSCLWRATLDVLSFMPLAQVDPFAGVILTDWYVTGSGADERLKINVRILDHRLRADALKISVFKQKLIKGQWVDQPIDDKTARDLEDAVLTKARQLHLETGL